jgi:hypothetical protein
MSYSKIDPLIDAKIAQAATEQHRVIEISFDNIELELARLRTWINALERRVRHLEEGGELPESEQT